MDKMYMKTEKFSAENKWWQTQFNKKMGKYGKSKLKNIVKYNLLALAYWCSTWLFYGWPILGSVTCVPLQNLCKQKRSVSRHFFIELNNVLAFYLT